jgi:alpha-ribazole phosphatase
VQPTTVWLIRHALVDGADGRCYGKQDVPLSPDGIRQAQDLGRRLASESISHIYSSDLSRSVQTARILAEPHRLQVQCLPELREIDFGDLEGLTFEEIEKCFPEVFQMWMTKPTEIEFPNGESFAHMRRRVLDGFDSLLSRHLQQCIAVVSHAGVIRLVLASALGMPDDRMFRIAQNHCSLNRIRYYGGTPILELLNG